MNEVNGTLTITVRIKLPIARNEVEFTAMTTSIWDVMNKNWDFRDITVFTVACTMEEGREIAAKFRESNAKDALYNMKWIGPQDL